MPYGMYISAEGAQAQSRRIEVIANNLANVQTLGFKREIAVLQARNSEAIEQGLDSPGSKSINDIGGGVYVPETMTEFKTGPFDVTGQPDHLALRNDAFFMVERDGEQFLTRAGNFVMNDQGQLTTQQGYPVLDEAGGPIEVDPTLPWQFESDGTLSQDGDGTPLAMVRPASLGDLARHGENLFRPLGPTTPLELNERAGAVTVGCVEQSSVEPTTEMMEMISASRAFETNIRLIQQQDEMLGGLVNRVMSMQ